MRSHHLRFRGDSNEAAVREPEVVHGRTLNRPAPVALTNREEEITLLVGRGLTTRRIAQELSISERALENHIAKILKKLWFSSRARIATWVAQR